MKKILILTRTLSRGGVPNALVSFLQCVDITNCKITIGIEINKTDLKDKIDPKIEVIPYNDLLKNSFFSKLMQIRDNISKNKFLYVVWKFLNVIEKIHTKRNIQRLFGKNIYDSAIAFHQGNATKYISKYIKSNKKIYFYHAERIMPDCREKYFSNGDYIVCSSIGVMNLIKSEWKRINEQKIKLCHYVVDYKTIREKANEPVDLIKKPLSLITVGRLVDDKGYDLLIETALILKKRGLDFIWNVLGDGPLMDRMKELIKNNKLKDNVKLFGAISNPYKYMKNSDILVSTSKNEAFGLVISEAQIIGKTVVATKTSGSIEQVVDGISGYLVNYDSNDLSDTICLLFNNKNKMNIIEANLSKKDYSDYNKKCAECFEELTFLK